MNNSDLKDDITICVIDAMVDIECEGINSNKFQIITDLSSEEALIYRKDNGHGNAVCSLIHEKIKNAVIILFPVTYSDSPQKIVQILKYIYKKRLSRIVNISLGFFTYSNKIKELEQTCNELLESRIYIVAAEPNVNAYPACFESVIGVATDTSIEDISLEYFCRHVRIIMKDEKRILWWRKNYIINDYGSSFAAAELTGLLAGCIYDTEFADQSIRELWKQIESTLEKK